MLDFMLSEEDVAYGAAYNPVHSANATFRVGPDHWIECKFGGCRRHEAWRYDGAMIYLDEDHSMNGGAAWNVHSNPRPWAARFWTVGSVIHETICMDWPSDESCRVSHGCHMSEYETEFVEFVEDFDFGGDLGARDAVVLTFFPTGGPNQTEPEINVYARGAGRVFWSGPETPGYNPDWRAGPFLNVAVDKSHWDPGQADTCEWRAEP